MKVDENCFNSGVSMFQRMVSLSIIVGEIMDTFYRKEGIVLSLELTLLFARSLQMKLSDW